MASEDAKKFEGIQRGRYGSSPLGTAVFVGFRAFDGFILQRALQVWNPIPQLCKTLGFPTPPQPPSGGASLSISSHNLRPFQAIIWSLSIASALKQIFWLLVTSKEPMSPSFAIAVGLFNTTVNSLNTVSFAFAAVNPTWSETSFYAALPVFALGIAVETISEIQRKSFKDDPKNKGKLYTGGLFGIVRHPNYLGYMLWRSAFALATGGWAWAGASVAAFWFNFTQQAIPELDEYSTNKYGEQWAAVKRKVPYAFFPGVQ